MNKQTKQQSYQAPALDKGLDILEYLAVETEAKNQSQIAEALGRNQSELYRMLACLEHRGYISKEGSSYRLTLRMYQVGRSQNMLTELRRAARLPMELLAEKTGQSCHMSMQHGGELLVLLERTPARRLCLSVGEGGVFPLWRTASGKVLLGSLPEAEREYLLDMDEGFAQIPEALRARAKQVISQAEQDGYLAQESDMTDGVFDVAMPVSIGGSGPAVLALSSLESSCDDSREDIIAAVAQCADQINRNLGMNAND